MQASEKFQPHFSQRDMQMSKYDVRVYILQCKPVDASTEDILSRSLVGSTNSTDGRIGEQCKYAQENSVMPDVSDHSRNNQIVAAQ